jgi:hypothetical protein
LSVLAVSFGKRVRIEEREGLYHWPSIFFSLIAETGERKGPPFKLLTSPLEEWAEHEELRRRKIRLAADAKNAAIDAATTALKTRARHDDADIDIISAEIEAHESRRVPTPPSASIFTTDITEERLFQKMHERGGVYAVLSGEGRPVIDALLGKYTSGNLTGDAIYLAGITGDTITRDRVGDGGAEERIIRDPALNVCIMVQPDKFSELAVHHSLKSSGALARIWPTILPSLVGTRLEEADEPGLQMQHLSPYYDLVHHLLGLCHTSASEGARPTHTIKLSSGAANARREWHNRIEWQMATGEELEDARDIACRAVTQTCKLALIIHVAENPEQLASDDSTLSLETWLRAEEIGNFHLQEAVRIRRMSEQDPLIENALRTIEWIVRKRLSRVSARDLQRSGPRPRPNADDALRVLSLLEEHGYLARRVEPGKKPSFIVNPQVLSPDSPMSPGNPGTQDH